MRGVVTSLCSSNAEVWDQRPVLSLFARLLIRLVQPNQSGRARRQNRCILKYYLAQTRPTFAFFQHVSAQAARLTEWSFGGPAWQHFRITTVVINCRVTQLTRPQPTVCAFLIDESGPFRTGLHKPDYRLGLPKIKNKLIAFSTLACLVCFARHDNSAPVSICGQAIIFLSHCLCRMPDHCVTTYHP